MQFSEELKNHLSNCCWWNEILNDENKDYMERYSYPLFVKDFMKLYGGVVIEGLGAPTILDRTSYNYIILDISQTDGMEEMAFYSDRLNKVLYVIGTYQPKGFDIAVDENGYVYLVGETCYCYGSNLYEGMEAIVQNKFFDALELDPTNKEEVIWLAYKNDKSVIVELDAYIFEYTSLFQIAS